MSDRVLLTVGIPTHNGEKFLREAVASVVARMREADRDDIEILISDNASTDSTAAVAAACAEEFSPYVSVVRNKENLGFDKNVDLLFQRAQGTYVELLGDDDFLEPGHFQRLLPHLEAERSAGAVILGVGFLDIVSGGQTPDSWGQEDHSGLTGNELFTLSGWRSAAMSSVVIETRRWRALDLVRYYGSGWIHVAGLLHAMARYANASVLSSNSVVVRVNNDAGTGTETNCSWDCAIWPYFRK